MTEPKIKINFKFIHILIAFSVVIWLGVMLYYVNQLPDIHKVTGDEIKKVIAKDMAMPADIETKKGKPTAGININDFEKPTEALLDKGAAAYKQACASCHGDEGKGDGIAGSALNPKPRDFRSAEGWKNPRTIAGLFKTLQDGIPGTAMTAYEFLPVEDRLAIIHFIRKMAEDYPEITASELKQLSDDYDLATPKLGASQIPLALAKSKILEEAKNNNDKIASVSLLIQKTAQENALLAELFADCGKAAVALVNDNSWANDFVRFTSLVFDNPSANGFKPSAMKLSKDKMLELHNILNSLLK